MGDIHALAINGNLKGIKQALGNKRLLSSLDDEKGWSPLHYAANKSKAKIVQVILDAGINPNIKSKPPEGQKQNDWNLALEDNKENKQKSDFGFYSKKQASIFRSFLKDFYRRFKYVFIVLPTAT